MIIERKHKTLIQQIASYCFNGSSSEEIVSRVQSAANFLNVTYSRTAKVFLKYFLLCLRKEFGKNYAIVQHAGPLNLKQWELVLKAMGETGQIVAEEHPELIGGIKIKRGDTVWDFSLQGQLQVLMKTLK